MPASDFLDDLTQRFHLSPMERHGVAEGYQKAAAGGVSGLKAALAAALEDERGPFRSASHPDHVAALALHTLIGQGLEDFAALASTSATAVPPSMTAEDFAAQARVRETADRLRASGQPDMADHLISTLK